MLASSRREHRGDDGKVAVEDERAGPFNVVVTAAVIAIAVIGPQPSSKVIGYEHGRVAEGLDLAYRVGPRPAGEGTAASRAAKRNLRAREPWGAVYQSRDSWFRGTDPGAYAGVCRVRGQERGFEDDDEPPAPGWYADPARPGMLRYWDGTAWTEHQAPGSTSTRPAPSLKPGAGRRLDHRDPVARHVLLQVVQRRRRGARPIAIPIGVVSMIVCWSLVTQAARNARAMRIPLPGALHRGEDHRVGPSPRSPSSVPSSRWPPATETETRRRTPA